MTDPLWYQDALIYEVHVRAFADSNADGIGDFRGLADRLDYLQDLGVTAIWLLPFYPSPLRDDGYDIAAYKSIHPSYGTMPDFRRFLKAAHDRNLKVITELVINHTSDQHPWFQRARKAPPGSSLRDFYVWSDTPDRYQEARIIFQDTEASNWTWDPVANAYYWHRFFSHQPDLNFENPAVHDALIDALDFWLDLGVDGLRLDAVPYLYEREGTMCENLPETHAFLKKLRRHVDGKYEDRMFLAEANQWPEDSAAYFGDGDECQMAFHFPLMPRLFMSIRMENRFPVIDILEQTPEIPDTSAWAIFLRNHDELTLEMVTDEERDYMYRVYARDPQARLNLGIRRRLAPLLGNNRREMELMNAILFSLPGTPVLYYGDEIGMGDNIYLGDRNGVRTPMQWSGDRNAGFSRANPQKLYLPVIVDPEYHYEAVNIETQQSNPHSLWWWMKRMMAQRRSLPALSRGDLHFLTPDNPKVLVFERRYGDETVLVVANLSRHVQAVELDLSHHEGITPVEVFGRTRFPQIGELPYFLTMGAHEFYWFRIETTRERVDLEDGLPRIRVRGELDTVFRARTQLERTLAGDLPRRRWFRSKAQTIAAIEILDLVELPGTHTRLGFVRVDYVEQDAETYVIPLALLPEDEGTRLREEHPAAAIAHVTGSDEDGLLYDGIWDPSLGPTLLRLIASRRSLKGKTSLRGATVRGGGRLKAVPDEPEPVSVIGAEQSNSSIVFDERVIMKIFRRLDDGENPEVEIGRFLTERAGFEHTPRARGILSAGGSALAFVQDYVPNQGDAWSHTVDIVGLFFDRLVTMSDEELGRYARPPHPLDLVGTEPEEPLAGLVGPSLPEADLLGRRTGEMHLALATETEDPAFRSERMTTLYQRSLYQAMRNSVRQSFQLLRRARAALDDTVAERATELLDREKEVLDRLRAVSEGKIEALRIRIHGDYHLGQVLFTGNDFVIIDFEGEPLRPVSERRIKRSPLRDVAGMLRSYHYAVNAGLLARIEEGVVGREPEQHTEMIPWADAWHRWVSAAFLGGYLEAVEGTPVIPEDPDHVRTLLDAYMLEKAVYELGYELNNRPTWVGIALDGVLNSLE